MRMTMKVQFDVEQVAIKDLRAAVEKVDGIAGADVTFHNTREAKEPVTQATIKSTLAPKPEAVRS
jgi:hypothetical protein